MNILKILQYNPISSSFLTTKSEIILNTIKLDKHLSFNGSSFDICGTRHFHLNEPRMGRRARAATDAGTTGESSVLLESTLYRNPDYLPDINLPDKLFSGVPFKNLPIVNIKATPNNTILNLTDYKGVTKLIRSCGVEGFKNTKKGTNIAAQATALTFSQKALQLGYKTVRVRVQGLGPGRMSSVNGLVMGGMDIVSLTDNTHASETPPRPKKLRRI